MHAELSNFNFSTHPYQVGVQLGRKISQIMQQVASEFIGGVQIILL